MFPVNLQTEVHSWTDIPSLSDGPVQYRPQSASLQERLLWAASAPMIHFYYFLNSCCPSLPSLPLNVYSHFFNCKLLLFTGKEKQQDNPGPKINKTQTKFLLWGSQKRLREVKSSRSADRISKRTRQLIVTFTLDVLPCSNSQLLGKQPSVSDVPVRTDGGKIPFRAKLTRLQSGSNFEKLKIMMSSRIFWMYSYKWISERKVLILVWLTLKINTFCVEAHIKQN